MSMYQEYAEDRDWIEALGKAVRDEEDFQEGTKPNDNHFLRVKFRWQKKT